TGHGDVERYRERGEQRVPGAGFGGAVGGRAGAGGPPARHPGRPTDPARGPRGRGPRRVRLRDVAAPGPRGVTPPVRLPMSTVMTPRQRYAGTALALAVTAALVAAVSLPAGASDGPAALPVDPLPLPTASLLPTPTPSLPLPSLPVPSLPVPSLPGLPTVPGVNPPAPPVAQPPSGPGGPPAGPGGASTTGAGPAGAAPPAGAGALAAGPGA